MVVTARTAFFVWLVAIVAAAAVPITCAVWSSRPYRPKACVETYEIITSNETRRECPGGGHMVARQVVAAGPLVTAQYEVRCVCDTRSNPDASSP